jgi:hypothetical protein
MTGRHPARINVKLRDLSQLFNSMDPSPFLDRDLDHDAEEFIISWSRELPRGENLELVIHLGTPPEAERLNELEAAVQHYFHSRAELKQRELRQLLRQGHFSLSIGLLFLCLCLFASGLAVKLGHEPVAGIVREGLIIAGWVAMWRPLETYLYDWWPLRDDGRILQRLARMRVRVIVAAAALPAR